MVPITLTLFAAPFLMLLFYALPATDDFCKATLAFDCVPQRSVLAVTWLYYTGWSPRWLTTLIQSLVMSHFNLVFAYGWLLLAVILSNILALAFFFRAFFRWTRATSLLAAAIFYAAWVASLPTPAEENLLAHWSYRVLSVSSCFAGSGKPSESPTACPLVLPGDRLALGGRARAA